jgi:toxin-antitoxin system PIN domain toxin
MFLPDVNILVYALDGASVRHHVTRAWLEDALDGPEALAISATILTSVVRVATGRQVGAPMGLAMAFVRAIANAPAAHAIEPGAEYWNVLELLLRETGASGGKVSDISIAALAIEHDCTLVTFDRHFDAIKDLRVIRPH